MDFWMGLQIYLIVAVALAGTSYITIYRPSMELLEEILEQKVPRFSGWLGTTLWLLIAFVAAPWTAIVLISNDNNEFIENLAVKLATDIIEEEDKE